MTGQKTSLNKLKTEIIPTILSDDNGVKLEQESWNTYKYVESKQHTPEQPICQRRNQKRKLKIPSIKQT